ncbi:MAG: Gfo/Idh/MocA family oxidoreductase [Firmicutes bacterium]|nr:Gfo/Idh/MocA family oxidoreductase [Bacillota bacterium]
MKIGMIGCGSMGRTHSFAVEALRFFYKPLGFEPEIAAVSAAHYESAMAAAEELHIKRAAASEDELISDPDIDIIDICTPNIYHYATLKKAIGAGKHVYCEKPLCVTYKQAKEIAELAAEKGVTAQIVFNNRFMAPIMRAKEIISEGRIGNIVSFNVSYLHSSATDINKTGWKQDRDICGGGVLFDLGSHIIDLIYYLCGEFETVSGRSQIYHKVRKGLNGSDWNTNADEAFYLTAELCGGAVGTIEASKLNVGTNDDLRLEIYGERGALKFDLMEPNWLWFYDGSRCGGDMGGDRGFTKIECVGRYPAPGGIFPGVKAPVGWLRGHIGSMYSFLECVAEGKKPCPSFDDGAYIQKVMERAYESADNNSIIMKV